MGEAAGYELGEAACTLKVASILKNKGMSVNEICEITALKPEQIEKM